MGKLTASMVVDLTDKTGAPVRSIIGNLDRLKRAERDLALAERGAVLSKRDLAMERLMIERQRSVEERSRTLEMWATRGSAAALAVGAAAGKAYVDYAATERRINRIVINADRGAEAIQPTIAAVQKIALATNKSVDDVTDGLQTLVASGRSLEESLSFLPSVAITAQASDSAIKDIALSADALAGSLKISATDMQKAFDELVIGGKLGKFELQDMSRYLPSIIPAFAALGYKGTDGLAKLVAMLQVVRNQTGTSEEAATNFSNVLQKIYSPETALKFKKLGIDLPASLDRARKNGKDVLQVFLAISNEAVHGDLSKLPLLFQDAEVQKGMRALLTQPELIRSYGAQILDAQGAALKDFNQTAEESASKIQKLSTLWSTFMTQVGSGVATFANPTLEATTGAIDEVTAERRGYRTMGLDQEQQRWQKQDFDKRYRAAHPDDNFWEFWKANEAYRQAVIKVGRGEARGVFDAFDLDDGRRAGGEITARYPSRGSGDYDPAMVEVNRQRRARVKGGADGLPVPLARPEPESEEDRLQRQRGGGAYPSPGTYDATAADLRRWTHEEVRRRLRNASLKDLGMDGMFGANIEDQAKQPLYGGRSPDEREEARSPGPQTVILSGTPTVTITNPPPRPNIVVNMTVNQQTADPDAVVKTLGDKIRDAMHGIHADTNYAAGL